MKLNKSEIKIREKLILDHSDVIIEGVRLVSRKQLTIAGMIKFFTDNNIGTNYHSLLLQIIIDSI